VKIAIFTLIVTQLFNVLFVYVVHLAHAGLALAISMGACINAALLYWQLRKQDLFQPQPGWPVFLVKLAVAVSVMSAVLLGLMHVMPSWSDGQMLERFIRLGALVVSGVVAYFGMLLLLGFRLKDFARKAIM
jgi:putative peptidoglycan lipid II flippase